jgi:hypothetical protein
VEDLLKGAPVHVAQARELRRRLLIRQ